METKVAPTPIANSYNSNLRFQRVKQITSKFFNALNEAALDDLLKKLVWLELKRGEVLCKEGEAGDCLYLLLTGRLKALVEAGTSSEREVGEISQGESVGEMSLITGETRNATILAVRDSTLVKLVKPDFDQLVLQHPEVLLSLSRLTINRLNYTMHHARVPAKTTNIALVPLTDSEHTRKLVKQLVNALKQENIVHYLHRELLPVPLDADEKGASDAEEILKHWLAEQEMEQDFVVFEAEQEFTLWTQQCLKHADKIVVIKEVNSGPALTELESIIFQQTNLHHTQNREIVLLYPENTESPEVTHDFLTSRPVKRHYNIRLNDKGHIGRLARMIVNKGVGLVLGGGGAKGFAHIGIYRALIEKGIPIDMVCGTSMGAVIAAVIAHEWSPEEIVRVGRSAFVKDKPLNDYTLPVISLLKGHKLQHVIKRYLGNYHIEDLWLNYFCISSNFTLSEMVVHERGPLWKAVTASVSIPGVLPPVVDGNNLLIDGASFNNFPVDIMKAKYGGKLVGINLLVEREYKLNYTELPGGWHMFFSKFLPFLKRYRSPGIASIMLKSTILSSMVHQRKQINDLELNMTPPVARYSLLDLNNFDRIVTTGYTYGKEYLEKVNADQLSYLMQGA